MAKLASVCSLEVDEDLLSDLAIEGGLAWGKCLQKALKLYAAGKIEEARFTSGDALQSAWDRLHGDTYKDCCPVWRRLYSHAGILVACCAYEDGRLLEALRTLDMILLLSGPHTKIDIHTMVARIEKELDLQVSETHSAPSSSSSAASCARSSFWGKTLLTYDKQVELSKLGEAEEPQRLQLPSITEFQATCFSKRVPAVIERAMEGWPAMGGDEYQDRSWRDLDYLKSLAGRRTVPVEVGRHYLESAWSQHLVLFSDFLDNYVIDGSAAGRTTGYLAQHQLFDQIPALRRDIVEPDYCILSDKHDNEPALQLQVNGWVGPAGTVSPLHHDPYHNLLCQVVGHKYVRLYSPEQSSKLYPCAGLMQNSSQVDVEDIDLQQFPEAASAIYCHLILSPGEMLYIPPGCWHYVRALTPSLSVSFCKFACGALHCDFESSLTKGRIHADYSAINPRRLHQREHCSVSKV